jgi:hypothetical protein
MTNRLIIPITTMTAIRDYNFTAAATALRNANPRSTADRRAYAMGTLINMILPDHDIAPAPLRKVA